MSTRFHALLVALLAASLAAPVALAQAPGTPSEGPSEKGASAAEGLTEFQVRHSDLVERSRKMALERGGAVVREVPEPSSKFDKAAFRAQHGDRTVTRGRAWEADAKAAPNKGAPGIGLSLDFGIESIDLDDASGITGFLGTPPDTMGAVGPTQFFTAQNSAYRVHDKLTGAAIPSLDTADSDFWIAAVDPNDNGGGDPRVRFDRINNRWVIIAFELGFNNSLADNRLLLAHSDGPIISGATVWTQYFFVPRNTTGGGAQAGCFADYPMLGVDKNAIYIGANMFDISSPAGCGGDGGTDTAVFVVPLNQLPMGGGNVSGITTAFDGLLASTPIWSPMPADNFDPTATEGYVIGHDAGSDTVLKLGKIANPAGTPGTPTISWTDINISDKNDGYANGVPYPGVPNPTGTIPNWGLAPLGFRPLGGAMVRDGKLWTAMTSSVDGPTGTLQLFPATGDRHSVVYFEIDVDTDTLVQDGNVFDRVNPKGVNEPTHLWMGSVAVNGQGHAVVGATGTNTDTLAPSAMWAGRLATDPLGEFTQPSIYLPGTDTGNMRHSFETSNRATRWGDYAQVTVDPCDDMTFYAIAEYQDSPAVSTGGNWATAIARITAPAPAFLSVSSSVIEGNQASVSVTVTGEGFYQTPSTGMPACRTELEASTDVPGFDVNGVTFLNPQQIVIDFDTTGVSGPATVTITNPDGQTTSFGIDVGGEIFLDGFEIGNTSQWSSSS